MRDRRIYLVLVIGLVVAIGLIACGDDKDEKPFSPACQYSSVAGDWTCSDNVNASPEIFFICQF